jgi:hypothetical protein
MFLNIIIRIISLAERRAQLNRTKSRARLSTAGSLDVFAMEMM